MTNLNYIVLVVKGKRSQVREIEGNKGDKERESGW